MKRLNSLTKRAYVFICYSHKDNKILNRLQVHLNPLSQNFDIIVWDDTKIKVGSKWKQGIKDAINNAKIAMLLISPDFMGSEFISSKELPPLLEAAKNKGTIILSDSLFSEDEDLNQYQAVNDPTKPLYELSKAERDKVLSRVARTIKDYLTAI